MKIVVCDDEPVFLEKLKQVLQRIGNELDIPISIVKFCDGNALLQYYDKNKDIDLFILDILMNPISGYNIAKYIRKFDNKCKIIFLSSISNYAIEGYNLRLERYLLKPVSKKILMPIIKEIYSSISQSKKFLMVKNVEGFFKLYLEDIYFIETEEKHVLIHTQNKNLKCYQCLKSFESRLDDNFFRCHSSFIVNLLYIESYYKLEIVLKSGDVLPISKHRKSSFTDKLLDFYAENIK